MVVDDFMKSCTASIDAYRTVYGFINYARVSVVLIFFV
jgi:hypothetical protein